MGMQIPYRVYTEISQESVVSAVAAGAWGRVPGFGPAAGKRDHRGAPDGRSCAYVDLDSSKATVSQVIGYNQGEECDSYSETFYEAGTKLCRLSFLGTRILCINSWSR